MYLYLTTLSYLSVGKLQIKYIQTLNTSSQLCLFTSDNNFIPEGWFNTGKIPTNTEHKFSDMCIYIWQHFHPWVLVYCRQYTHKYWTDSFSDTVCVFKNDNNSIPKPRFTAGNIHRNTEHRFSDMCIYSITDNNFIPECRFTAGNIRTNTEH